ILKHNWKLKTMRDMLLDNPSIKQVNDKPIVLQWFEDLSPSEQGQSNYDRSTMAKKIGTLSDASELCDDGNDKIRSSQGQQTQLIGKDSEEQKDHGLSDGLARIPSQQQNESIEKGTSQASHASLSLAPQGLKADIKGEAHRELFTCPHCSNFETESHIVIKHQGKPGYPD